MNPITTTLLLLASLIQSILVLRYANARTLRAKAASYIVIDSIYVIFIDGVPCIKDFKTHTPILNKMPSEDEMVFSFKRIKFENFLSMEDVITLQTIQQHEN